MGLVIRQPFRIHCFPAFPLPSVPHSFFLFFRYILPHSLDATEAIISFPPRSETKKKRGGGKASTNSGATMPFRLRWAIGAVKDQTSISLAKVSSRANGSSNLEVAILKATSHDEVPIDDRHITEVLLLTKSSPLAAAACVQALSRRLTRTSNWVVALKSLILVLCALRDAGPDFSREALSVAPRRRRLLDLSTFCDDSSWDFTAFVRTYALYLDARLDSALLGKLGNLHRRRVASTNYIATTKLPLILDRIGHWQRLLDRAIATRPTGPARTNRLVQISLYAVVRESFDLYRDVSDALSLLLDNFFNLEFLACRETFRACTKAAKQFQELDSFYTVCKKVGIGRSSEYPTVRTISKSLLKTLDDFLKDHENSSTNDKLRSPPPKYSLRAPRRHNSDVPDRIPATPKPGRLSICSTADWEFMISDQEWLSEGQARASFAGSKHSIGDTCGTLSDLLSFDDEPRSSAASSSYRENGAVLAPISFDSQPNESTVSNSDRKNGMVRDLVLPFDAQPKASSTASNSARESGVALDLVPLDSQSNTSTASSSDRDNGVALDLIPFDSRSKASTSPDSDSWELVLVESANKMSNRSSSNSIEGPKSLKYCNPFPLNYHNPFLHDDFDAKNLAVVPSPQTSLPSPTFHQAARPDEELAKEGADRFAVTQTLDVSAMHKQQQQQQMWMRKIVTKNLER